MKGTTPKERKERDIETLERTHGRIKKPVLGLAAVGAIARWEIEVAVDIQTKYFTLRGLDTEDLKEALAVVAIYMGWKIIAALYHPTDGVPWARTIREYMGKGAKTQDQWINKALAEGREDELMHQAALRGAEDEATKEEIEKGLNYQTGKWNRWIRIKGLGEAAGYWAIMWWAAYEIWKM